MSQKIVFTLILIVFGLAFAEFAAFITGRYILPDHLLFAPSYKRDREEQINYYAGYLTIRNPVTGWPLSPGMEHEEMLEMAESMGVVLEYDAYGARTSPAFPDPAVPSCVSLYGDSFTWSSEVEHEEAWGNLLATQLDCRVHNFGVGGYGSDQAYLRYITNALD